MLDAFTTRDLDAWDTRSIDLQSYHDRVYFDLERQRAASHDELCAALCAVPAIETGLDRWMRVTDWCWNLMPLSASGSLKGIGGRFNVGADLDRARGQAFPSLYIAQDVETAYREYFGGSLTSRQGKLTLSEFALRRETSFTTFSLRGKLDQVFDLSHHTALNKFSKVIARFKLTRDTEKFARVARLQARALIRTPRELWKCILQSPSQWRAEPQMFGIPAVSQIFGKFVRDAGFEAILYPSQQVGMNCLAVFPDNFRASAARIEVMGEVPPGATATVLDKNSAFIG